MQPTSGTPTLEYDSALYLRYPRGNSEISTLIVHTIFTHLKRQRHSALLDTLAEAALGVEQGSPFVIALRDVCGIVGRGFELKAWELSSQQE